MTSFSAVGDRLFKILGPPTTVFAPLATSRRNRPRAQWARAMAFAVLFSSMALALQADELADPTAVADLHLAPLAGVPQATPTPEPRPPPSEEAEQLLIDTRVRVKGDGEWTVLHPTELELRKRAVSEPITSTFQITVTAKTSTTLTASTSSIKSSTSASTSTVSTSATSSTATASSSPLPSFFDGSLSNNFTSSTCPTFIANMVAADEFQACYPISLLLQGSNSFFEAEESLVSISRVLDHACAANVTSCATSLAQAAANLTKSENCGDDYNAANPTVTEAYVGLIAYQVVYSATCLKDEQTSAYCFGDAVTNSSDPSQVYFYYLPLNSSLPGSTNPVCGNCLQDTMDIYHVATGNRKQPIANTYADAARDVDVICGPTFANTSLAEAITTSGAFSALARGPSTWLLATTSVSVAIAISWLV